MVKSASLWGCLTACCVATLALEAPVWAQDIDDLDEGVVMEAPFEPGIEPNVWELGFQVGYRDLDLTLLEVSGVVVDVENPSDVIFASMSLSGQLSFSPQVKINRTFGNNFALENAAGFAIGDFEQSISGEQERWTDVNSSNTVTEEETEAGSYFVWFHEHSLTYYPRGEGRIQPFVTAGAGTNFYFVDSAYVEDSASSFAFSYGGGLRVVGDGLYSFRLEVRNYHTSVEYTVSDQFRDDTVNLNGDAIVGFPVARLVDASTLTQAEIEEALNRLDLDVASFGNAERIPVPVESFDSKSYSSLWISLGFIAAF